MRDTELASVTELVLPGELDIGVEPGLDGELGPDGVTAPEEADFNEDGCPLEWVGADEE